MLEMWESIKSWTILFVSWKILFVFVWIHTEQKHVGSLTSQSGFELSESWSCIIMTHSRCILPSPLGKNCSFSLGAISACTFLFSPPTEVFVLTDLYSWGCLLQEEKQALFCRCTRSFISVLQASIHSSKWKRNIKSYPVSLGALL